MIVKGELSGKSVWNLTAKQPTTTQSPCPILASKNGADLSSDSNRMNPHKPSTTPNPSAEANVVTNSRVMGMLATAACATAFTLVCWIVLVASLDRPFHAYENIVWSGTLWLSAMLCSGLVACSRHSVRPVLSCTIAFGAFGLVYLFCEGPIFGNVAAGGAPGKTQFVVWNLACLPLGVFAATEFGSWVGNRLRDH